MNDGSHPVSYIARTALAIHEAMLTLVAPIAADELHDVLARDFPEVFVHDLDELQSWLSMLLALRLVSTSTNPESGALVYAAERP